jgi:2-polyprenyl-3-methyl-5-hydroxy-6-metoxy-1,4-benzoquinol methylase
VIQDAGGSGGTLMDIGCGSGVTMESLADMFHDVVGIEVDPLAVPEDAPLKERIVVAHVEEIDWSPSSVRTALMMDVVEHIEHPEPALRRVAEWLAPDGCLIVTVPAFGFLWTHHDEVNNHWRRYTRRSLETELEEAGFDVTWTTYMFAGLVAPKLLQRMLETLGRETGGGTEIGSSINRIAELWFLAEAWLCRRLPRGLPVGTSVIALARKRADA